MVVNNGLETKFWEDVWCGTQLLMREFPSVFSLVANPQAIVAGYLDIFHWVAV